LAAVACLYRLIIALNVAYKVTQLILGFLLYLCYLFPNLFDSNQLINQGLVVLHNLYVSIPMKSIFYHAETGLLITIANIPAQSKLHQALDCVKIVATVEL
jgi:type III secretory pathway component EscR